MFAFRNRKLWGESLLIFRLAYVYLFHLPLTFCMIIYFNILYYCNPSSLLKQMIETHMIEEDKYDKENVLFYLTSLKLLRKRWTVYTLNAFRKAFVGQPAPNPKVYDPVTEKSVCLLDYQIENRPLVLIFGNCT